MFLLWSPQTVHNQIIKEYHKIKEVSSTLTLTASQDVIRLWPCVILPLADEPELQSRQEPLWIPTQQTVTHKETYCHVRSTATTSIVVITTRHCFLVISGNQADQGKLWKNGVKGEATPHTHTQTSGLSRTQLSSVSFFLFLVLVNAVVATLPILPSPLRNPTWKLSSYCLFSSKWLWRKWEHGDEMTDMLQMQQIMFWGKIY